MRLISIFGTAVISFILVYCPTTIAFSGSSRYKDIRGEDLKKYMLDIVHFCMLSRHDGDLLWGRQAGTKYEKMTADYLLTHFKASGMDEIWQEEFPLIEPQWTPTKIELTLFGGSSPATSSADYQFGTVMTSVDAGTQTPEQGIEAEIVDIGYGSKSELKNQDLAGKIVLVHREARWSTFISYFRDIETTQFVEQGKALGAVFAIHMKIPTNMQVALWNGPRARQIAHLNIGSGDGKFLQKIIRASGPKNPPRARLTVRGKIEKDLKTQNTFGLIRGKNSNEYVVLIAHTDAWFEGAVDNASGLSVLLGLAKHYAHLPREQIQRNILFVGTGGHHNGPAVGTRHLARNHKDILDKTVILLNLEHFASVAPVKEGNVEGAYTETAHIIFDTHRHPFIQKTIRKAAKLHGTPIHTTVLSYFIADSGPFRFVGPTGVPCVTLLQNTFWYHTARDTIDRIPAKGLENVARTFALLMDAINSATTEEIRKDWNPRSRR
jgi:hypothetical protein